MLTGVNDLTSILGPQRPRGSDSNDNDFVIETERQGFCFGRHL